jgi:acetoacetyl-CoA synthetase
VWAVSDIPYTRSGKKMELAISRILAKRPLQNIEAVANPECLKEYEQYQ